MKKKTILTTLCLCLAIAAFAQGNGLSGINDATSIMTSYFYAMLLEPAWG